MKPNNGRVRPAELHVYVELMITLLKRDYNDLWLTDDALSSDCALIRHYVKEHGIKFLTKMMPSLGKSLDGVLSGHTETLQGLDPAFMLDPNPLNVPIFLGTLWRHVFQSASAVGEEPVIGAYKLFDPAPSNRVLERSGIPRERSTFYRSIAAIRQLAYMFYKLNIPYTNEQSKIVIDEFVDVDAKLPSKGDFNTRTDRILCMARGFIGSVLAGFDPYDIIPRHGPGSVATGETGPEKSKFSRIYESLNRVYPYTEYFQWSVSQVCDELGELQELLYLPSPCAKVSLVPKDSRGPRIISMEPLEVQWIQQGLMTALVKRIQSHKWTKGVINFDDQTVNREMAHAGSVTGGWVTMDMKEASDRVSLELFRALYEGTSLYEPALAARSTHTKLPDGRVIELQKFAPMGSALCFPVEALCFWSIAVAVLQAYYSCTRQWAARLVYVYGDDLIVPAECWEDVRDGLESYGLLVNSTKCCVRSTPVRFRESCGLDVIDGVDITPLRIKRRLTANYYDWVPAWVDQSNLAYSRGLGGLANALEEQVMTTGLPIPYVSSQGGIWSFVRPYASHSLNVSRLRFRFLPEERKRQVRGMTVVVKARKQLYAGYKEMLRNWSELLAKPNWQTQLLYMPAQSVDRDVYSVRGGRVVFTWSDYSL